MRVIIDPPPRQVNCPAKKPPFDIRQTSMSITQLSESTDNNLNEPGAIHLRDVRLYFIGNKSWWLRGESTSADSRPLVNGILNFFAGRPIADPSSRLSVNVFGRLIL